MKRILAALDRTETARLVLDRAVELATVTGAKVRLLRVVPATASPPAPNVFEPGGDMNALVAEAEADLVFRSECIPERLRDGVTVEVGEPWSTICEAARAYDADVVVIGAHRYGLLARMLGTTAAKVVNHVDRPVMVVRPTPPGDASRRSGESEPKPDERAGLTKPPYALLATLLRAEHVRLEGEYAALLETWRHGDWADVRAQFARFEPALRAHMAFEEERIFPAFRESSAKDAAALQREHDELRRTLDALAVGIELHVIGESQAEALVRQLRAHGEKEEQLLYPWLETTSGAEAISRAFAA